MANVFEQSIQQLELDPTLQQRLRDLQIDTIGQLWVQKQCDLKKLGFSDEEIHQIRIKLQLIGIDLNQKNYDRYQIL